MSARQDLHFAGLWSANEGSSSQLQPSFSCWAVADFFFGDCLLGSASREACYSCAGPMLDYCAIWSKFNNSISLPLFWALQHFLLDCTVCTARFAFGRASRLAMQGRAASCNPHFRAGQSPIRLAMNCSAVLHRKHFTCLGPP